MILTNWDRLLAIAVVTWELEDVRLQPHSLLIDSES